MSFLVQAILISCLMMLADSQPLSLYLLLVSGPLSAFHPLPYPLTILPDTTTHLAAGNSPCDLLHIQKRDYALSLLSVHPG